MDLARLGAVGSGAAGSGGASASRSASGGRGACRPSPKKGRRRGGGVPACKMPGRLGVVAHAGLGDFFRVFFIISLLSPFLFPPLFPGYVKWEVIG